MRFSSSNRAVQSRREFLRKSGGGFGALAFGYLLGREGLLQAGSAAVQAPSPSLRLPHFPATARSVIWLFMEGGPSHLDLFDPKPELQRLAGQPMPESFGRPITAMGTASNTLMPSRRQWRQHGQSGLWISDWFPHLSAQADKLCLIRSCWADGLNHVGSVCQMNTGDILAGRPAMGAWSVYGLGSANDNLPSFVILCDAGEVNGGPKNWSSGFLPAVYQGTQFRSDGVPIFHLQPPSTIGQQQQRSKLDLLAKLNRHFAEDKAEDTELNARLNSYELAWRMQAAAPEAVDFSQESEATRKLYGLDQAHTAKYAKNLLLARRLVERGVRFVQCYSGSGNLWDAHSDLEGNHTKYCGQTDQPIAGLLADLEARGLLDTTLVVWGGEFGRTPFNEKGDGRDHNPWGFTVWMAGGGIKGGHVVGATDELGLRAIEDRAHVHDLHATLLHCLGLSHEKLTYLHNGRDERPTINDGEVIRKALA
ncbi:MAG TPA: DUF1501 domain-containing protein [Verrucomicrobiae bacterium]|nr:DUF1501 domain-containing protein [Verrucomicrobiae bacterium]